MNQTPFFEKNDMLNAVSWIEHIKFKLKAKYNLNLNGDKKN